MLAILIHHCLATNLNHKIHRNEEDEEEKKNPNKAKWGETKGEKKPKGGKWRIFSGSGSQRHPTWHRFTRGSRHRIVPRGGSHNISALDIFRRQKNLLVEPTRKLVTSRDVFPINSAELRFIAIGPSPDLSSLSCIHIELIIILLQNFKIHRSILNQII